MARPTYTSRLLDKIPLLGDIVTFRCERPAGYDFRAGQWFVITFERGGGAGGGAEGDTPDVWEHHFSHSNSPTEPTLEFTTRMRGSAFKNALGRLPLGTELQIEGPYGSFVLGSTVERVVFITGGIGITSVRSILRAVAAGSGAPSPPESATSQEMVLLFANRSEEFIPFKDELDDLAARLSLRVVHVLSRPGEDWTGHRGHIDRQILNAELGGPGGWAFYLSGPPAMVEGMHGLLTQWGVERTLIRAERFDGY